MRWYVCGIYELCDQDQPTVESSQPDSIQEIGEEVLETPYLAPLAFEWSSADPVKGNLFEEFRDSLIQVFEQSPVAVIELTGLYDPQEINNTDYENLGLARAENIKQLLLNSGIKRSYSISSDTGDLSSGISGNINNAYLIQLVARQAATDKGFVISQAAEKMVIYFPSGNSQPESDKQVSTALQQLARKAKQNNNRLIVVGHTDNQGDALKNKKIGLMRAANVKEMLLSFGMDETEVLAESEGEDSPVVNNNSAQGRKQNRRVEILII